MNFNSFKSRLAILFAILFIMGTIFTITGLIDNNAAENTDMDFNYMDEYEFKDGMFVKGRVYEIYDEFAVEETYKKTFGITTSTRVSSHYYIIPMVGTFESDKPMYIALEISHVGMVEEAEKLMDQTWNYYDYGIEPSMWNEFDIKGKVSKLEGELLDYMYEWFMYGEENVVRSDFDDIICPYLITYRNTSSSGIVFTVVLAAIGAIGLTVMIMLHIKNNNIPKTAYNTYSNTSNNGNVPPYSPDAVKDMTDRGFPPPQPAVQNDYNMTNSLSNSGSSETTANEAPDPGYSSMPSVGRNTSVTQSTENNEAQEEKTPDFWGD